MEIKEEKIKGVYSIFPRIYGDERGYFFESFNKERYDAILSDFSFVQDNESCSGKNVVRGLHFQEPPFVQGKLVQVLRGKVLDVAVDLRKNSPTFGQHEIIELSAENGVQFYIPEGFAHGFLALEDHTLFSYKCTNRYASDHEKTLLWNDPDLGIPWPSIAMTISSKDQEGVPFKQLETLF
ncbi:MAG: dTDP-4-dehydrorhamnose 3,5-epimerase [Flavobacteriia bacterium]|nr:dTDP-4-dehydrorhamnose 3,5-epimerase [Flavobacteriia bacterium]